MKKPCSLCGRKEAHCDYCCTPALRAVVRVAVRWHDHVAPFYGWEADLARAVERWLKEKEAAHGKRTK